MSYGLNDCNAKNTVCPIRFCQEKPSETHAICGLGVNSSNVVYTWHPGEEFVYVLEGSEVLWQKDKPDVHLNKGDVFKVPLKQIQTAMTGEEGVTILVFRVHEKGQPVRINVE